MVVNIARLLLRLGSLDEQVQKLESKLLEIRQRKDAAVEKDLLMYIKSMPENQLQVRIVGHGSPSYGFHGDLGPV